MKKILVVDDDMLTLKSIENLLKRHDWSVDACNDPYQAIEKITAKQYDCLLLDVRMPGLSGPELLKRIRALEEEKKLDTQQVIFLTGYANKSAYTDALQHGAFNFLYKPFDAHELLKCIDSALYAKNIIKASEDKKTGLSFSDKRFDFLLESQDSIDLQASELEKITFEDINAKINAISPEELFWWYAKSGFFYPSKKRKLTPYLPQVEDNWKKAMKLGEEILWIATVTDAEEKSWASICNWRTTYSGWVSQHLVGAGHPAYPLMLMLGTQLKVIDEADSMPYGSFQNWYRPNNKYANKVFGLLGDAVRDDSKSVKEFAFFMIDLKKVTSACEDINIVQCTNKKPMGVTEYLKQSMGELFVRAEEYDVEDIELLALNDIYQKVGLQRTRTFFLALNDSEMPIGALVLNRAPLGLNFSMLENRCELILSEGLSNAIAEQTIYALLSKAAKVYEDFSAPLIPLITDKSNADIMSEMGFKLVRLYNQFIWTKTGYEDWYKALMKISSAPIRRWKKYRQDGGVSC